MPGKVPQPACATKFSACADGLASSRTKKPGWRVAQLGGGSISSMKRSLKSGRYQRAYGTMLSSTYTVAIWRSTWLRIQSTAATGGEMPGRITDRAGHVQTIMIATTTAAAYLSKRRDRNCNPSAARIAIIGAYPIENRLALK